MGRRTGYHKSRQIVKSRRYECSMYVGGSLVTEGSKVGLMGVANLLGLEVNDLERSLTSRVMTTTKGGAVGTIIK